MNDISLTDTEILVLKDVLESEKRRLRAILDARAKSRWQKSTLPKMLETVSALIEKVEKIP